MRLSVQKERVQKERVQLVSVIVNFGTYLRDFVVLSDARQSLSEFRHPRVVLNGEVCGENVVQLYNSVHHSDQESLHPSVLFTTILQLHLL